jgi:hypothetical protein
MRVLSSFSDSPRWASHPASRALTCSACCLERQQAAKSSAYAEVRVMPTGLLDGLPGGLVSVEGGGITRWSWRGYRLSRNASRVSGGR